MSKMKICNACQKEIANSAKVCPNCGAKQKTSMFKKWWFWVIIVIAIAAISSSGGNDNSGSTNTSPTSAVQEEIVYQDASVNELVDALKSNAMAASKKYKDTYLNLTGKLGNIDSDGRYFSLESDDAWDLTIVQCYMKKDEHKDYIATLTKGDKITVKVKVTDVGEVLGYSLDVKEIAE